jgi:pimeloyl-ACP methyl ester carboxylesterase
VQYFTHDGYRLAYEVHGSGDHTLVYLPGILLDANLNRRLAESLAARGHRVVLLDLLGHGQSDKPTRASEYRIDTYVDQVVALLDELGIERCALGGVSLGANVSLMAAVHAPDRVSGLVLEMPVLDRAVPPVALTFVPFLLIAHYAPWPWNILAMAARRLPSTRIGVLDSLVGMATRNAGQLAAVLHGVLVGPVAPTEDQRRALRTPTLILGHHGDLIHPFSDAARLAEQLPHARLLEASSLFEMRVRPERLIGGVAEFLDDLWASGTDHPRATVRAIS